MGAFVKVETIKQQIVITLDRSEKRNAFHSEMIAELTTAFQEAAKAEDARVLVLKGSGPSFSAGADLQWMKSMVAYSFEENKKDSVALRQMFQALESVPVPVVGCIQGHVMGGALGLVALCDIVAAVEGTKFCFSEVKMGLSPAVVSEFVVPKIPRSQIPKLFLTAELFDASSAKDYGLVHFVGTEAEVQAYTEKSIQQILKNGPVAVRATKALIKKAYQGDAVFGEYSTDLIARLRVEAEGQEGLGSFFEKRPPQWMEDVDV